MWANPVGEPFDCLAVILLFMHPGCGRVSHRQHTGVSARHGKSHPGSSHQTSCRAIGLYVCQQSGLPASSEWTGTSQARPFCPAWLHLSCDIQTNECLTVPGRLSCFRVCWSCLLLICRQSLEKPADPPKVIFIDLYPPYRARIHAV